MEATKLKMLICASLTELASLQVKLPISLSRRGQLGGQLDIYLESDLAN